MRISLNTESDDCMMKYFSYVTKERRCSKNIFCRGLQILQQEDSLLYALTPDPPPNQRHYSACSSAVPRFHLHKQGNDADELQATYCEPPKHHSSKNVLDQQ